MIDRFMDYLMAQVGSIYVWGAQGEVMLTDEWIRSMETSDKNAERAIAFWEKQKENGEEHIAAYDCSGLIVRFLLDNRLIERDTTASGLYSLCKKITAEELVEGDLVFRHNGEKIHHVGAYIGNGDIVHAKGRDCGVVVEDIFDNGLSYWNRFGRYEKLTLADDTCRMVFPKEMRYAGKTFVNLRSVPSAVSDDTVMGKVSAGDVVLVLGIERDWADVVKKEGGRFQRGFCRSTYLKGTKECAI